MAEKDKAYLDDDDLTEADRVILHLYEKSVEPIDWDQSDEAILAFAKSVHRSEAQQDEAGGPQDIGQPGAPAESAVSGDSGIADRADDGDNVVAFAPRKASPMRQFHRSPLAGLSIAATLLIGIVAGQGLSPYVDFGVGPDYARLLAENKQLAQRLSPTRSLRPGEGPDGTGGGQITAPATGFIQIADLFAEFSCANLSVTLTEGRHILVAGRVSSLEDMDRLQSGLSGYQRLGRVTSDVEIYGRPFCEVLDILETHSRVGAKASQSPTVRPANHGPVFRDGEHLVVEAIGTDLYEGYIYVDFIQGDGQVIHMLPYDGMPDNFVAPGERLLLGAGDMRYALAPPYGTELIMIISSPVPLFDRLREQVESVDAYLPALEEALQSMAAQGHKRKILSAYRFITTQASAEPESSAQ